MAKKTTIQERIKALIALASSPVEAEATAAMEKAQELLAKHNLSMSEVLAAGEKKFVIVDSAVGDIFAHKRKIGAAVAKLYFCKYFFRVVPKLSKKGTPYNRECASFAGEQHNADIALMMFNYLVKTIDRLAKEEADKLEDKKKYWSFQTAFKTAAAQRVAVRIMDKIKTSTAPTTTTTTTGGSNLPALASLYDRSQKEVSEFLETQIELTTKKPKAQKYDLQGLVAGHAAGDKIGLDTQVTSNPSPQLS